MSNPLLQHAPGSRQGQPYPLSQAKFVYLRDRLAAFCGVSLDPSQKRVLESAVGERLAFRQISFLAYERALIEEPAEFQRLAELVLNHETFFFRNQLHMRALCDVILPELHARKPAGQPLRMWSAGCSTGEEAYSLALAAQETLGNARPVQVWATDLSERALEAARQGVYGSRSVGQLSPGVLARYFEPHGQFQRVGPRLRSLVEFEPLNLLAPLPQRLGMLDIVFCQNVLIYFSTSSAQAFLRGLYEQLPNGACVFLGFSETLWNIFDRFRVREVQGSYVYYKETLTAETTSPRPNRPATGRLTPPRPAAPREAAQPDPFTDAEHIERGRALLANGHANEAIGALQRVRPGSPLAVEAGMLIARAHANRGELELAQTEVRRVIEQNALHEDAALLLGVILYRMGLWQEAMEQLERARYLNAALPLVSFYLANAYAQLSRFEHARREYMNTMAKLQPHPPDRLIDGVAVGWLRETCQRQIEQLSQRQSEP